MPSVLRLCASIPLQIRAMLALLIAVMLWGSSFIALKVAVAVFDPVSWFSGEWAVLWLSFFCCG